MSDKTKKAIEKRESKKPKPEKMGDYERELMKPNHIPGEYVD